MARNIHQRNITPIGIGFGVGTLILCALALFMCVGHSLRWHKWKSCYGHQEPVIQLNPQEIINYEFEEVGQTTCDGEGPVWKKNVLMGGKCQLPNFSGVIIYDSTGTVVTPAKTPRTLPWK